MSTSVRPDRDPDLAYIEHDFERALLGKTPLVASTWEELEQLCMARPSTRHFVARIQQRDYRYIRYTVLEKLKEFSTEDNLALVHPD